MFQARDQALARKKTLGKAQHEEAAKAQDKAARRGKVRAGKRASLDVLRAVNAFEQVPTITGETQEAVGSALKGRIKGLAAMNAAVNRAARDAPKHGTGEQARRAAAGQAAALPGAAAGAEPHRRAASASPAGRRHLADGNVFEECLQNRLAELNRFDARPYNVDRAGPAFSCKAHLRHRSGHFSFGLLAGLGAQKKMRLEEPPHTALPEPRIAAPEPPRPRTSPNTPVFTRPLSAGAKPLLLAPLSFIKAAMGIKVRSQAG